MKPNKTTATHKERLLLPNDPHQILRRASEPIPSQTRPHPAPQPKGGLEDQQYLQIKDVSVDNSLMVLCQNNSHSTVWDPRPSSNPDQEPTIQLLKDSIAALSKAKSSERSKDSSALAVAHFNFAFRQYGKALEGIREMASSTEAPTIKILLHASVLIFIFESLQGNSLAAITHLKSAYSALVTRDPSLANFALAGIIEDINEESSLNEVIEITI